jgi:hypothetical protein
VAGETALDWGVPKICSFMRTPCACLCCITLAFCALHAARTRRQLCSAGRNTSPWCRLNGGYKGVDFVRDIACPDIDFATLHVCEVPSTVPSVTMPWHVVTVRPADG